MRKAEAADKGTVESERRTIEKKETHPDLNREREDDESSLSLASFVELSRSHLCWVFLFISIFSLTLDSEATLHRCQAECSRTQMVGGVFPPNVRHLWKCNQ
jgi:hypothetical protein